MDFFGIGPLEFLLILAIAFIVLGPAKLPQAGRTLGKAARELRKATAEFGKGLSDSEADDASHKDT